MHKNTITDRRKLGICILYLTEECEVPYSLVFGGLGAVSGAQCPISGYLSGRGVAAVELLWHSVPKGQL